MSFKFNYPTIHRKNSSGVQGTDGTTATVFYVPSAVVQFLAFAADNEQAAERTAAACRLANTSFYGFVAVTVCRRRRRRLGRSRQRKEGREEGAKGYSQAQWGQNSCLPLT